MALTQRLPAVFLCLLVSTGCGSAGLTERRAASAKVAAEAGWQQLRLDGGPFVVTALVPANLSRADTLSVYIEGDGLAWLDAATPSFDPTPLDPLALQLALRQPSGVAAYLARPCQYVTSVDWRICQPKYWTSHRFAPEVIEASNQALDQLKQRFGARRLVLVGYSGGGAVAALLAARRSDIEQPITPSGNPDHHTWTTLEQLSPLSGSLNPADQWQQLLDVPQIHFVGGRDRSVANTVAEAYRARFPTDAQPMLRIIEDFDHHCCWVREWPVLYPQTVPARRCSDISPATSTSACN